MHVSIVPGMVVEGKQFGMVREQMSNSVLQAHGDLSGHVPHTDLLSHPLIDPELHNAEVRRGFHSGVGQDAKFICAPNWRGGRRSQRVRFDVGASTCWACEWAP